MEFFYHWPIGLPYHDMKLRVALSSIAYDKGAAAWFGLSMEMTGQATVGPLCEILSTVSGIYVLDPIET